MEKYVGKRKKSRARPVGYYLQERRRILFDDVYIVFTLDILISEEIKNKHDSICNVCIIKIRTKLSSVSLLSLVQIHY